MKCGNIKIENERSNASCIAPFYTAVSGHGSTLPALMLNFLHMEVCQERLCSQRSFRLDDTGLFHLPCQQKESWTEN